MRQNIGIILAGGIGTRFGADKPKQYLELLGKEMIAYSIECMRKAKSLDDFIVVLNSSEFESGRISQRYGVKTINGGTTRNKSFKNALDYIAHEWPNCEKVVENNAACPLTRPEWLDEMMELLDNYDWVQTTLHITDALGSIHDRMCNRDDYYLIQSPNAYRLHEILECFDPDNPNGHPAVQLPITARGKNLFRDGEVFKVTHPSDIEIVELMLRRSLQKD